MIPLFEQRRVLVKIKASKKPASSKKGKTSRYHSLHLWLKLAPQAKKTAAGKSESSDPAAAGNLLQMISSKVFRHKIFRYLGSFLYIFFMRHGIVFWTEFLNGTDSVKSYFPQSAGNPLMVDHSLFRPQPFIVSAGSPKADLHSRSNDRQKFSFRQRPADLPAWNTFHENERCPG